MSSLVVVGAQWGDEGKGKIVDVLSEEVDVVARYSGGSNAGHTLVVPRKDDAGYDKIVVRLLPSGIMRPGVTCVLGSGMVIDPTVLLAEVDSLMKRGTVIERLLVDAGAHLILPYHRMIDEFREGGKFAVGTTRRGIGPAYEDKVRRNGVRVGVLRDLSRAERHIARALDGWRNLLGESDVRLPSLDEVMVGLAPLAKRISPWIDDVSGYLYESLHRGASMLFEGAQGTLLDVDHGTYPYVTSSSTTAGGVCTGLGIGPTAVKRVLGIAKAYVTRVGGGPFPTELTDSLGEHLRNVGGEFGSVTGRSRRCGWLDLPALRYASRINGMSELAVTKLDVLTGVDTLKVCVGYRTSNGYIHQFPVDELDEAEPVYSDFPGWTEAISSVRSYDDLPANARAYVEMISREVGIPVSMISVGPERDAIIRIKTNNSW